MDLLEALSADQLQHLITTLISRRDDDDGDDHEEAEDDTTSRRAQHICNLLLFSNSDPEETPLPLPLHHHPAASTISPISYSAVNRHESRINGKYTGTLNYDYGKDLVKSISRSVERLFKIAKRSSAHHQSFDYGTEMTKTETKVERNERSEKTGRVREVTHTYQTIGELFQDNFVKHESIPPGSHARLVHQPFDQYYVRNDKHTWTLLPSTSLAQIAPGTSHAMAVAPVIDLFSGQIKKPQNLDSVIDSIIREMMPYVKAHQVAIRSRRRGIVQSTRHVGSMPQELSRNFIASLYVIRSRDSACKDSGLLLIRDSVGTDENENENENENEDFGVSEEGGPEGPEGDNANDVDIDEKVIKVFLAIPKQYTECIPCDLKYHLMLLARGLTKEDLNAGAGDNCYWPRAIALVAIRLLCKSVPVCVGAAPKLLSDMTNALLKMQAIEKKSVLDQAEELFRRLKSALTVEETSSQSAHPHSQLKGLCSHRQVSCLLGSTKIKDATTTTTTTTTTTPLSIPEYWQKPVKLNEDAARLIIANNRRVETQFSSSRLYRNYKLIVSMLFLADPAMKRPTARRTDLRKVHRVLMPHERANPHMIKLLKANDINDMSVCLSTFLVQLMFESSKDRANELMDMIMCELGEKDSLVDR